VKKGQPVPKKKGEVKPQVKKGQPVPKKKG